MIYGLAIGGANIGPSNTRCHKVPKYREPNLDLHCLWQFCRAGRWGGPNDHFSDHLSYTGHRGTSTKPPVGTEFTLAKPPNRKPHRYPVLEASRVSCHLLMTIDPLPDHSSSLFTRFNQPP